MAVVEDTNIYPVLVAIMNETVEQVAATSEPVEFASFAPGATPSIDHTGAGQGCSEVIVSLTSAYPTGPFPDNNVVENLCSLELAYVAQVAVFRCAPMPKRRGNGVQLPTEAEQLNASRLLLADMNAIKRAICKVVKDMDRPYAFQTFEPYGPQGGAVGAVWSVVIGGPQ